MLTTSNASHIWTGKEKNDSILLKGSITSATSPTAIFHWLLDQRIGTGLEDVMTSSELLHLNAEKKIIIRRLQCKSDRLMFSSRSFVIVTFWFVLDDNSCVIVTRSLPKSVFAASEKNVVRGTVHTCGYYIKPIVPSRDGIISVLFASFSLPN